MTDQIKQRDLERLAHAFAPVIGDHLDHHQFAGLIDDTLAYGERSVAEQHLADCRECHRELAALTAFAANEEQAVMAGPATAAFGSLRRFIGMAWLPLTAASAMLFIIVVGSFWYWDRQGDRLAADMQSAVPASPDAAPAQIGTPLNPTGTETNSLNATPELAVKLIDGPETVGLDPTGTLVGYDSLSAAERKTIETVLKSGNLPIARELSELRSANSATMGDPDETQDERFDIVGPVGKVVITPRPLLRWKPLVGSTGYRVDVFDTGFNKVTSSNELSSTTWSPNLSPGTTYIWQVTAFKNGREVKSPVRPAPEARFRILDATRRAHIASLKRHHPNSHFLLGVAYADAGLIDEATAELKTIVKNNPGSNLAKKFLRQVTDTRR